MRKKDSDIHARCRVLVLVDESNVGSSVRTAGRGLDWLKLRDFLAGPNSGRDLIDLAPLFRTFGMIRVQDAPAPVSHRTQSASGGRRRRPRFRPVAASQQAVKS